MYVLQCQDVAKAMRMKVTVYRPGKFHFILGLSAISD